MKIGGSLHHLLMMLAWLDLARRSHPFYRRSSGRRAGDFYRRWLLEMSDAPFSTYSQRGAL
jgi:hypothetical protein